MKFSLILLLVIISLAGCASTPNVVANVAPDVDFSQYSTFGFYSPLATDRQGHESMVSNFLKVATAQELDRRGLTYSDSPDLMVNFFINTRERIRSRSVPTARSYYAYRTPFGYAPFHAYPAYETQIDQYTEGTLNIDVVDVKSRKVVWEGAASGRVTDRTIRNLEQSIDSAVAAIMRRFPL